VGEVFDKDSIPAMATIVAWLALGIALAALGYAWKLNQELETAGRRLDRYNKALFDTNDELRRVQERLQDESARLRVALRRQASTPPFSPEMTVREALLMHPQTEQVLAGFHLGGCDHCAVEPDATLAQASAQAGIDVQQLVGNLNLLVSRSAAIGEAQAVKLPNVALEF
jgi:hypothetical protein